MSLPVWFGFLLPLEALEPVWKLLDPPGSLKAQNKFAWSEHSEIWELSKISALNTGP